MKKQFLHLSILTLLTTAVFTACKKEKGESNEEEVITTMQLTLTPHDGSTPLVYKFEDADGPGGAAPSIDQIVLASSETYDVALQLLNKTVNPAEDITEEIEEEADAHRFYFEPAAGSNITISGLDKDGNGVDLGVNSTWTTGAAATGSITITLRHYPAEPPNKAAGDAVNSQKSGTDIEATFTTKIQ
ncbi:hypothetical protein [Niastella populi]|uniref:Type 1 periplasmic binding fold superfamily protein n=1 Tax=Niastella populi TaxID=550983 RepID=A0A1V9ERY7_9BACT|nr:hypothetical protein [Niastella populi]OQP48918.1 hypothetical protein A4R26_31235 [Niastella populi]